MKCAYKQCKLGNEVSKDEADKKGNRYYHKECLQEIKNKEEIRKLFLEKINEKEVITSLNGVIKNLIENKGVSSEFLLYALKYVIKNKTPLNHAPGLCYIVNNEKIKEAYNRDKLNKMAKEIKNNDDYEHNKNEIKFNINIENNSSWDKILGR